MGCVHVKLDVFLSQGIGAVRFKFAFILVCVYNNSVSILQVHFHAAFPGAGISAESFLRLLQQPRRRRLSITCTIEQESKCNNGDTRL